MSDNSSAKLQSPYPVSIVYFGTPGYAVPALKSLAADRRFVVDLVVTQPDRPAGRGHRVTGSPVKQAAIELGLPIYQPPSLGTAELREPIASVEADLFVVAAFGLIFGGRTLELPRLGCVNLHASLLPSYRGASPVAVAILAGDDMTGVSLMIMDEGIDTGPVIGAKSLHLNAGETTASLTERLGSLAAVVALELLPPFLAGRITARSQDARGASLTRQLTKADGWMHWQQTGEELERFVRAMWSWPRAWTTFNGTAMQIHAASVIDCTSRANPGQIVRSQRDLHVNTGQEVLRLDIVQSGGGRPMNGREWLARYRDASTNFGITGAPATREALVRALDA